MAVGGISTSLDIQESVAQIMEYERQPLTDLETRKTNLENQISSWDNINASLRKLQTTLNTLQRSSTFNSMAASSSDPSFLTATADVNAAETTYTFSNVTLATAATTTSSGAIGLSDGTPASISSGEQILSGAASVNPNAKIGSVTLDPGQAITTGSFYINGKQIHVTINDTIYTILSKINSSNANVVATFADDQIAITQKEAGVSYSVRVSDDTTGFFEAMKLDLDGDYPSSYGVSHDYYLDIKDTALSGTIQSGYFNINNITFSVNVNGDSLSEIVNRINDSSAGVLAYYDDVDDKITLTSTVDGQDISLSNDTANFFAGVQIAVQDYSGTDCQFDLNGRTMTRDSNTFSINGTDFTLRSSTGEGETVTITVEKDVETTKAAVQSFVDQYNATNSLIRAELATGGGLEGDNRLNSIARSIRSMVTSTVSNEGSLNHLSQVGITLDHSSTNKSISFDPDDLIDALEESAVDVFSLFAVDVDGDYRYTDEDEGFSVTLDNYIENFSQRFSGFIVKRNDAIRSSIERLESRIEKMEEQMDRKEESLITEFQDLQNAMSKLESISYSSSSFLSQLSST